MWETLQGIYVDILVSLLTMTVVAGFILSQAISEEKVLPTF